MPRVRGRIIRILDKRTVVVNLGREHGIQDNSVFSILAEPEAIIDPFTDDELGRVNVIKSKLKASQVYDKFTIATTKWIISRSKPLADMAGIAAAFFETEVVDQGELIVKEQDIQPWKAQSEIPVQVGDFVEAEIPEPLIKKPVATDDLEEEKEIKSGKSSAESTEVAEKLTDDREE